MAFQRLRHAVAALSGAALPPRAVPQAGYLRGLPGGAPVMMLPRPVLRDARDDVRAAWSQAAARTVDAIHNNGWLAGVVEAMVSLMVGDGLRPNLKPDFSWAGWDARQEGEWARLAERRFQAFAGNKWAVDAGGRYTLAQIQAATVRSWFGTGEAVADLPFFRREGIANRTKVRLIPSHWLSQKSLPHERLDHGVFHDAHGAPAGYLFEVENRLGGREDVRRAARDGFGRPRVVHVFDGQPGQVRGITPFAPILRVLRDYDQLSNATLSAAMIHAIFAATIESDAPSAEVLDALTPDAGPSATTPSRAGAFESFLGEKMGWYQNVDIDLGRGGRIAHLFTGESLKLNRSEHPNSSYEPFANFLLREIARCAGAMFEDLTGDYRGATYSSVRMGIAKQWPLLLFRRRHVPVPISQAVLEAFLEEEVDAGRLVVPGGIDAFVQHRDAICRAEWRGPAKPQADEVKAARAHQVYRDMGVITDEQICSDLGADWEDVYYQRAFEKETRAELAIHGGLTNGGTDVDDIDSDPDAPRSKESA